MVWTCAETGIQSIMVKGCYAWELPGKRRRGRPKIRFMDVVRKDNVTGWSVRYNEFSISYSCQKTYAMPVSTILVPVFNIA